MSKFVTLHGFGGGSGGTDLNFEVVGGTTEPTNPTENTIWVNTDVPITKYHFSVNQPENMSDGEVWFSTGTFSLAEFDVFKDNSLLVYPLRTQQYIDNILTNKTTMIYQNGEWKTFGIWLIDNENCVSFTCDNCSISSVNSNGLNIRLATYSGNVAALFWASNMYDLTNINTISTSGVSGTAINNSYRVCLATYPTTPYFNGSNHNCSALIQVTSGGGETILDVSDLTGLHYVGFHILAPGSSTVVVPQLKLG